MGVQAFGIPSMLIPRCDLPAGQIHVNCQCRCAPCVVRCHEEWDRAVRAEKAKSERKNLVRRIGLYASGFLVLIGFVFGALVALEHGELPFAIYCAVTGAFGLLIWTVQP